MSMVINMEMQNFPEWNYKDITVQMTLRLQREAFMSLFKNEGEMLSVLQYGSRAAIGIEGCRS